MIDTISRYLSALPDILAQRSLMAPLRAMGDRFSSRQLTSAALAGTAVTVPSTGASSYALVQGVLRNIANSQALAALSGSVANAAFNVFVYYIDVAGTLTTRMGTPGATLAAVKFPEVIEGRSVIGFTIINPTGTGPFVGGTTNFNDATVVPNAVHVSLVGGFDPSILL